MGHFNRRWLALTTLFGGRAGRDASCSCGHPLPALETCNFVFRSGKSQSYMIGQCGRCHTVYWEES